VAQIVGGVLASHTTLTNTHFDEVQDRSAALGFRAAMEDAAERLRAAEPDVVVCFGSNHFRGFYLDLLPPFTIGVGEVEAVGENGTPKGQLPTDPAFARHLLRAVSARDFDVALSLRLQVDHGISHSLQHLVPALDVPVVPIVTNVFAPPLPSLARCAALGAAVAEAIADDGSDRRVAIIGSGGLSHQLPFPRWDDPQNDDEAYLVDAWLNGRTDWQQYEARRRQIVSGNPAAVRPDFDRAFLDALTAGDLSDVLALTSDDVLANGGNGAQEIRTWIAAAAALGGRPADVLGYWPIDEWKTGMAVAAIPVV
jgi:2,3-dihydroxyphenylpropionate 1,2-dioxygenase